MSDCLEKVVGEDRLADLFAEADDAWIYGAAQPAPSLERAEDAPRGAAPLTKMPPSGFGEWIPSLKLESPASLMLGAAEQNLIPNPLPELGSSSFYTT